MPYLAIYFQFFIDGFIAMVSMLIYKYFSDIFHFQLVRALALREK